MKSPLPKLVCSITTFCVMAAAGYSQEAINSSTHPALQRALTESPEADKSGDGVLSLEEYRELLKPQRPHRAEAPTSPLLPVRENGDIVLNDFENNNVLHPPGWSPVHRQALAGHPLQWHLGENWHREGTAFNRDLNTATRMMKRRVGSFKGQYFLTTITEGAAATGRMLSPVFLIEQEFILITMSGGRFPGRIGVNLHLAEGITRSATGQNDDYFERVAFDVREFRGQLARIELLDNHRGLWGHLNVDEIVQSNQAEQARIIKTGGCRRAQENKERLKMMRDKSLERRNSSNKEIFKHQQRIDITIWFAERSNKDMLKLFLLNDEIIIIKLEEE